jgi:15-cis-phytoene synthase
MTTPVTDPALQEGYEMSRRMLLRHDPTYYFATRRLPAELRPATHALYGYVRTADQIVDGPRRPPTPAERCAALDAWEAELGHGGESPQPIVRALADAAARHRLPLGELRTYMRSMRIDCGPVRIGSWDELVAYMDGSAGSVGRIMAALLDVPKRFHADFGRLGQAFQLTNFIRDVADDWELDRIYLPGVEDVRTPAARGAVMRQVDRARALFALTEPAIAAAPASVRSAIRLACAAYLRILDRAEAAGGDVLGRRIGVRARDVPAILAAGRR